jgi:hypothetical protein
MTQQRTVTEHCRLWLTGCAGRVEQHRKCFGIPRRAHRLGCNVGKLVEPVSRESNLVYVIFQRRLGNCGEKHPGATVVDHRSQLCDRGFRIDRDSDIARAQRGEVGNDKFDAVRTYEGDPLAGDESMSGQSGGDGIDLAVELGPGHCAAYWSRLNHGDALRLGRRVSSDKISEICLQLFGVGQRDPTDQLVHAPESGTTDGEGGHMVMT